MGTYIPYENIVDRLRDPLGDYGYNPCLALEAADVIERLMAQKDVVIGDNKYLINLRLDGTFDILFNGPNGSLEGLAESQSRSE